ncbi:MAG TPA: triose-phosphate isomerase, partial [Brevibacterium sp.]|nr:triose-phosphate isomerase [Brevibacterium sp.]
HHAEDDAVVGAKLRAALRHELTPVLCVGEDLAVREAGDHIARVLAQVDGALEGTTTDALTGLVLAYEPVWAIGTGETAGAAEAQEMASAIRTRLAETHGDVCAGSTRILYGGSVAADNVVDLVSGDDVDGALVGGASLDPTGFADLIDAVHRVD